MKKYSLFSDVRYKYSRVPVYEGDKDHVIGVLNLKDVFCYSDLP